jgi:2-polyprenyl-6-methoxyphenol hydroxylase-like FAD-dependent oxidoreductase
MTFRDTHLRLLAERDDAQLSGKSISDVERRGIGRTELRQLLLEGLNSGGQSIVRWGKSLTNYEYLPDGRVHVRFTDASSDECDVLIGADGCHSRVRQQLLPQILRQDLGILAIAGRYVLDKRRTKDMPRAFTDGSLNNIVPHGKGWMFLTSWHSQPPTDEQGNERDAEHYVMWAYVVPKAETPPNAKAMNAGQLRDIALTGVQGWSPLLATLIQGADLKTVAPVWLKSMPQLEQWPSSNVTLLGDAIHNMTPVSNNVRQRCRYSRF